MFSKVARFDFPRAWPTLFSDLLAKLQVGGRHWLPYAGIGRRCPLLGWAVLAAADRVMHHGRVRPKRAAPPCLPAPSRPSPLPQDPSQLVQRRVYLVLHHILKELASKRLAADQRNLEQAGRRRC